MSQTRLIDYGTTVTSNKIIAGYTALNNSGSLITGPIVAIGSNTTLQVNPYTLMSPQGVIISETSTQTVNVTLSVNAAQYTLILVHQQTQTSGGTAASLSLVSGFFDINYFNTNINPNVQNATVLAWLDYPGGLVPLDPTMLYIPRSLKRVEPSNDNNPIVQWGAPFGNKWYAVPPSGPAVTLQDMFDGQRLFTRLTNPSDVIILSNIMILSIVNGQYPPSIIRVNARADFQANVLVTILDSNGTEYTPSNNSISDTAWGSFAMKLPNLSGTPFFAPHTPWFLKLTFLLNPSTTFDLQVIDVTDYNLPVLTIGQAGGNTTQFQFDFVFTRISSVISFWDPTQALPTNPSIGDRYIASATNSSTTWVINNVMQWSGTAWVATAPVDGDVTQVVNQQADYVYNGFVWATGYPQHLLS